ncbi:hypothetical protein Tco_1010657 [Tanacetum coccineum]
MFMLSKWGVKFSEDPISTRSVLRTKKLRALKRLNMASTDKPSLEELMNKHLEESTRRIAEMEEWVKRLQENAELNTQNQSASLKNLETHIEQLTKEFHAKTVNKVNDSSSDQCKAIYNDKEASINNEFDKPHEVSFDHTHVEEGVSSKILCRSSPR